MSLGASVLIATAATDGKIAFWHFYSSFMSPSPVYVIDGHQGGVQSLVLRTCPDDPSAMWSIVVFSAGYDGTIRVTVLGVNRVSADNIRISAITSCSVCAHGASVVDIVVDDQTKYLYSVSVDKRVVCWRITDNVCLTSYRVFDYLFFDF